MISEPGYNEDLIFESPWPDDGLQICADYDYSDAPDWANERSWYIKRTIRINTRRDIKCQKIYW